MVVRAERCAEKIGQRVMARIRLPMLCGLLFVTPLAFAQAQDESQRFLPFPDRQTPGSDEHVELLKRLQKLVEAIPKSPSLPQPDAGSNDPEKETGPDESAPQTDPESMKKLTDLFRNLSDRIPPGLIPPGLGEIPQDDLKKAMQQPEMQEKMKQLLEQFARDGLLPRPSESGTGESLPIPPQPRTNDGQRPATGDVPDSTEQKTELSSRTPGTPQSGSSSRRTPNRPDDPEEREPGTSDSENESTNERKSLPQRPGENEPENGVSNPEESRQRTNNGSDPSANDPAESNSGLPRRPDNRSIGSDRDRSNDLPNDSANGLNQPSNGGNPLPDSNSSTGEEPKTGDENSMPFGSLKAMEDFLRQLEKEGRGVQDGQPGPQESQSPGVSPSPTDRKPLRRRDRNSSQKSQPSGRSQNGNSPEAGNSPIPELPGQSGVTPQLPSGGNSNGPVPSVPGPSGANGFESLQVPPEVRERAMESLNQILQNEDLLRDVMNPDAASPNPRDDEPNSPSNSREAQRRPDRPSSSEEPEASRSNAGDSMANPLPEIRDFLKQERKNLPSPSPVNPQDGLPRQKGRDSEGRRPQAPDATGSESNTTPRNGRNPGGRNPGIEDPSDIVRQLDKRGLRDTLQRLMENAKKRNELEQQQAQSLPVPSTGQGPSGTDSPRSSNGSQPGGLRPELVPGKTLEKMAQDLSRDLQRIAEDGKFREREFGGPSRPGRTMEPPSVLQKLRDSASEMLSDVGEGATENRSAPSVTSNGSATDILNAPFDFTPAILLGGLMAGAICVFLAMRWRQKSEARKSEPEISVPVRADEIRERGDVVRAFHHLARSTNDAVADWWTHRAAAERLAEQIPEERDAVGRLLTVYEHARYMPEEVPMTEQELAEARQAVLKLS